MRLNRRQFVSNSAKICAASASIAAIATPGCVSQTDANRIPDLVWGRRGISDGRLMKPRAMAVSPTDDLYVVDMLGRIQVFDPNSKELRDQSGDSLPEGKLLRGWRTPFIKQGKPVGLGWSNDNMLLVADTHYYRVLFYLPDGTLNENLLIGGEHGDEPGQFHFVTDVVQDQRGHFFVGQYGQLDQIQEFDSDCQFVRRWGSQGSKLGEFSRPQALLLDDEGLLWVADACNHRVQVFEVTGAEPKLVHHFGKHGQGPGQLQYPYGFDFDADGTLLVAEYGNHRIQRFSRTGESLATWGGPGTKAGQFMSPWALIMDSKRNLHVLDSLNHRVQRYNLS